MLISKALLSFIIVWFLILGSAFVVSCIIFLFRKSKKKED